MTDFRQVLDANQISKYKAQGYDDQQLQNAVDQYERESGSSALKDSYNKIQQGSEDPRALASNTLIAPGSQQNLIQWQLELDTILQRVEHMLRGDKPKFVNGSLIYMSAESNEEKIFTDFGVSEIMRTLSMYLNRNTILSNYDEELINRKVYDYGNEVKDLIYLKYEHMFATLTLSDCYKKLYAKERDVVDLGDGKLAIKKKEKKADKKVKVTYIKLSDEISKAIIKEQRFQKLEKRKLYPMIVRELVDVVHSAYLRALNGGERRSLHEARSITQSESLGPGGYPGGYNAPRERSLINPMRYFKGKSY